VLGMRQDNLDIRRLINPAYELFIFSADGLASEKRYMLCVTTLAQAWEMFFTTFAYSNFLYRPFFADGGPGRDRERFDRLESDLGIAMRRFTFDPLRNMLINTVLERLHPGAPDEPETAIARVRKENFGQQPTRARVEAFHTPPVREVLLQLQEVQIGELRNRVVHKDPYRPCLVEVDTCLEEEIRVPYETKNLLSVRAIEQWQIDLEF
jgi:hypothetical protein